MTPELSKTESQIAPLDMYIEYERNKQVIDREYNESKKDILGTMSKLNEIQQKASCGTVRTLDKIADGIDYVATKIHNMASWLRKVTWKMPNVCKIKFKKEK